MMNICVFHYLNSDHGLEVITEHMKKTNFPWLMSNVIDNETGRPLGSGKSTHIIKHNNIKIGFMGLVEKEWLDTLPTIDPKEVTYTDFTTISKKLAIQLQNEVSETTKLELNLKLIKHFDSFSVNQCTDCPGYSANFF